MFFITKINIQTVVCIQLYIQTLQVPQKQLNRWPEIEIEGKEGKNEKIII